MSKKGEYHIKIHSRVRLILAMIVILFSITIAWRKYVPQIESQFISYIISAVILAISFYLASLVAAARIIVVLTEDSINHFWKQRFLFSREKNIKILFKNVDYYDFRSDRVCDTIIVYLKNKMKYKNVFL